MDNPVITLTKLRQELRQLVTELETAGISAAQAERTYRVVAAKAILLLKKDNMPVTLIMELVKGDERVAEYRFNRDVADVRYKTTQERINAVKREITIVSEQINREWGNAKYEP